MLISLFTSGYSIDIILILMVAILISATLSIVVHEISHGGVAFLFGDPTAKLNNRLTLNPLAHFDLIGLLFMLIIGFGWAKPVPINPNNFKNRKLGIVLVSIAGVASNLIMCGIALLLLYLLYPYLIALCLTSTPVRLIGYLFLYILQYMVILNIMLAFFNILPIAPLDGFNFINSFLPSGNKFSYFMRRYGGYILIGLIVISNVFNFVGLSQFNVFYQVQQLALRLINLVTIGS